MFPQRVLAADKFAGRFVELLPEYLPGVDTGAFEPTDRRKCWNKSLREVLTVIGQEDYGLTVTEDHPTLRGLKDQSSLLGQRAGAALFAMTTGWGDKSELEMCLERLEAFKCPQKLFVYSCTKWQEAVVDQIRAALQRYPYHMEGEQYLFMNLVGAESRFHLMLADVNRGGQAFASSSVVQAVPGSPFRWTTSPRASAMSTRR